MDQGEFRLPGEQEECENIEWVEDWKKKLLAPTDTYIEDYIVNEGLDVTFSLEDSGHISYLIQPSMHNLINFFCDHASIYIIYLCTCHLYLIKVHVINILFIYVHMSLLFMYFILSCRTCLCYYCTY